MALAITEDWIRERVQLKHNNLEDVRSLSLPGTYHEKIQSLNDSLHSFARLKALDLSRNSLNTLTGLENLKLLEKLNVYYNNIESLEELHRLRYNSRLQELDLRLNPVARNEPDYRLFLIHMLPNLRRLDDRSVRDGERKAALMHFGSDQASQLTEHRHVPPQPDHAPVHYDQRSSSNPRVEHVRSLARPNPITALAEDDVAVLDMVTRQGGDLSRPRPITGSKVTAPDIQDYTAEVKRQMNRAGEGLEHPMRPELLSSSGTLPPPQNAGSMPVTSAVLSYTSHTQGPQGDYSGAPQQPDPATAHLHSKYPNLVPAITTTAPSEGDSDTYSPGSSTRQVNGGSRPQQDRNLQYQDEVEAYTSYKAQGHFTPHPSNEPLAVELKVETQESEPPKHLPASADTSEAINTKPCVEFYDPNSDVTEDQPLPPPARQMDPPKTDPDSVEESKVTESVGIGGEYARFITTISSMVDKYWNGNRSLLRNQRFKSQMCSLLTEVRGCDEVVANLQPRPSRAHVTLERDVLRLKEELRQARDDNAALREKLLTSAESSLGMGESGHGGDTAGDGDGKMRSSLIRAQRDLGIMRGRLQKSIEENKGLQERLSAVEGQHQSLLDTSQGMEHLDDVKTENDRLKQEVKTYEIRLRQAGQMQELATMLQESHKSLVQTNEHLLRDLEDTRRRHQDEVRHLTWTYQQTQGTAPRGPSVSTGQQRAPQPQYAKQPQHPAYNGSGS